MLFMNLLLKFCKKIITFTCMNRIDAHIHLHTLDATFVRILSALNKKVLIINTDVPFYPKIKQQEQIAKQAKNLFPEQINFLVSLNMDHWQQDGWSDKFIKQLTRSLNNGATGLKIWKNIGMGIRDDQGEMLMIDNPVFDPLLDYLENNKIPVLGHLGEPKNCWLPFEEMTINSDREYFSLHPEYHMALHPGYPSYEDQILARDRMLRKHPGLIFIGAHLASLEWSVDELARRLDEFPNLAVDLAERVCHLQYQSIHNHQKVKDFMVEYQDRIIYGTDVIADNNIRADDFQKHIKAIYANDMAFLSTEEEMSVPRVNGSFKGLKLPQEVIDKIYFQNAVRWYKL